MPEILKSLSGVWGAILIICAAFLAGGGAFAFLTPFGTHERRIENLEAVVFCMYYDLRPPVCEAEPQGFPGNLMSVVIP